MSLRIAICVQNKAYAERLKKYWDKNYRDKLEVSVFSDFEYMAEYLKKYSADFVLLEELWKENVESLKECPPYALLTKQEYYVEQKKGAPASIRMYQRGDELYKEVIREYANSGQVKKEVNVSAKKEKECRTYVFLSAGGGRGASTVSEAFARRCAKQGKVLKLDLQFCSGMETSVKNLDDILFALKSRRYILPLKLEADVRISEDGVATFGICENPIDLLHVSREEMRQLLKAIEESGNYNTIIIDIDGIFGEKEREILCCADRIVCVADESRECANKFQRLYQAILALQQLEKQEIISKLAVFLNRFQSSVRPAKYGNEVEVCGFAVKYKEAEQKDIIYTMEATADFSNI